MDLSWMAWTTPTAVFFLVIASLILSMCVWEYFSPGGGPRLGILGFETTRGDRLFISLLLSAIVCLFWLLWVGSNLWWALLPAAVLAVLIFLFV